MTDITLYIGNKNYSSWSMRPWVAMKAAGLPFKEEMIHLSKTDTREKIRAHSLAGKVPVLKHAGLTVWDSLAICEYVADTFPHLPFWPEDREARATARSICAEMHSGFPNLRTTLSMNIRRRFPTFFVRANVMEEIDRILQIWAHQREKYASQGDYLFGAFSTADAYFAPVVTRFVTYGVKVPPICQVYMDAVMLHPAVKQWVMAAEAEPEEEAAYEYLALNQ